MNSKWVQIGIPENLAVSCIVSDPNNPQILYVGTGESYTNGNVNGNGIWKSIDGGNSWSNVFGGVTGATYIDANTTLTINSPSTIAGDYIALLTTAFGNSITSPITKELILLDDGTAPNEDGCTEATNGSALNGKIAVVRRGSCNFSLKAKNAQDAGAVAIIIANNDDSALFNMAAGDSGTDVTIPSLMISKKDGDTLINELALGSVDATLSITNADATNGTIVPGIQHVNDIIVRDNAGVSEVYIAAGESAYTGGARLGGDSFGIYKSLDGTNFNKLEMPKTDGGKEHEPNDLEIASDNSIYLSTTRSATYGDGGGVIFKSTDGNTFTKVYTITDGVRTQIEVSPTNANTVYVLAQMSTDAAPVKMFKTVDNFDNVSDLALPNDADTGITAADFTRGQAFYDLLIKVDPNNENTLYVGGIDLFKSTDAGATWNQFSHWYGGFGYQNVHADQHALAFASSSKMVFGNDGGVYFSNDGGTTTEARNKNYNTVQFYTVGVAPTTAFDGKEYFLAGAQDNGTQLISEATSGINSSTRASGGDGAASFFDVDGTDKYYITNYVYNDAINLYDYVSGTSKTINSESGSNGDFINQEDLDSNLNILYSNYSKGTNYVIKRYSNLLGSISKMNLTNDLMDRAPSALKVSPHTTTSSKLYVGLGNGKLLKVEDANTNTAIWSEITGAKFAGSVSDIEFGNNENEIFVTMHNYGVVSIWYTNDGGVNWLNKEGDFPDIPVKSILQNPLSLNEVIIGTNLGVWITKNFDTTSPTWTQSYNGMSYVPVLDLDLRDDNTVFAATYGRGIFSGSFLDPNEDTDGDGVLNKDDNCVNTKNPGQEDADGNGIGDVCEDTDEDGIYDVDDNCPNTANPDQIDTDKDGNGDACQDTDGDGVMDNIDNCIDTKNADQADIDNNGIGDACQDTDGDGVLDINDNCPTVANPGQEDADSNGIGDVCEDADGDEVYDVNDNCINTANPGQEDSDNNGIGDACQDTDEDGVMDNVDNCVNTKNADQTDVNNNNIGDVCDTSYADQKNIKIETLSETCVNQKDGKITVTVEQTYVSYKVTITGGKTEAKDIAIGETSVTFEGLNPSDYEVCVEITDRNYKQCFEINIAESATISLRAAKNQQSKDYTFNVTAGTAPYDVYLNGDLIETFNQSNFTIKVERSGVLEVKTAKSCEGRV